MNKLIPIIILSFFISVFDSNAQVKVAYDFPAAMSEKVRAAYFEQCEKGRILYQINCAGCHNYKVKRKEFIPDFTPGQLSGYELRILNSKHETDVAEEKVSGEELGLIMTFLTYKKKNRVK